MAAKTYKVLTERCAEWCGVEVGKEAELDLTNEQRTALVAAGWLEEKKGK